MDRKGSPRSPPAMHRRKTTIPEPAARGPRRRSTAWPS